MQLGWQDNGACRTIYDPVQERYLEVPERVRMFFPEPDEKVNALASQACATCPVLEKCREWSILTQPHGYSGGMTERERGEERTSRNIWLSNTTQKHLDRYKVSEIPCPSSRGYKMHLRRNQKVVSLEKGGCGCLEEHRNYSKLTKLRRRASEMQGSDTLS